MAKAVKKRIEPVLKVGWWVAVTLKPDTAPLRAYVGKIQAIDDDGMQLTLIDWVTGMAESWDFYIPHRNVESAFGTENHDVKTFGVAAGKWQTQMDEKLKAGADSKPEP